MAEIAVKKALDVLGGERITVECQTCGEIFLDMNYRDFLNQHSWDDKKPDRWFVKGAIHYLLNKYHLIVANIPLLPTNLTEMYKGWRDGKIDQFGSEEKMLEEANRYLANCNLPI